MATLLGESINREEAKKVMPPFWKTKTYLILIMRRVRSTYWKSWRNM